MSEAKFTIKSINQDYLITSAGTVHSSIRWRGKSGRELTQHPNSYGYMRVRLIMGKSRKTYFVHKLVAEHFLGPKPSCKHQICHINGVKSDNRAENLRWGTAKENAADRSMHGKTSKGPKHYPRIKIGIERERSRIAHLMAAAPEMYDLLSRLASDDFKEYAPTWHEDISKLLSKARGEAKEAE